MLILAVFTAAMSGADTLSATRVYTEPPGILFNVDGVWYRGPATFMWPAGSKHVLSTDALQAGYTVGKRFNFKSWVANATPIDPAGPTVVITADPAISTLRAEFSPEYSLTLSFFRCADPACPGAPGTIYINRAPFTQDAELWFAEGTNVTLQAVPNAGYVFTGWISAEGAETQGFINTVAIYGPRRVYPHFVPARRVDLATVPEGLQLSIDRQPLITPVAMEWGWETSHTVAPVSPQTDNKGRTWVFSSWSDGGAATHAYKVAPIVTPASLTATFVPGARASFLTSPPGLKLKVDGRDTWFGGYNFSWGVGETHKVEAPAEQTGADGRRYVFRGWSSGGPAAQDVLISDAHVQGGLRMTATYEALGRLTVQSSLPGVVMQVDGADCATPCVIDRAAGTQVRLAAPASLPAGEAARHDFTGWSDSAAPERTLTMTGEVITLRAGYKLMNRLVTAADPAEGARWVVQPASSDGYYAAEAVVTVAVEAGPGFRFKRCEGDLSGPVQAGTLQMTAPRVIRAVLDRVPYLPSAAVRSAAGEVPAQGVAPGSLISISGLHLAQDAQTGPTSPMAQSIAGVTVRLGDRLLPLLSVSPEEIKAHLPYDAEPGAQVLALRRDAFPEVKTAVNVVRNAPGLFAAAAHEDGSPVSVESPARAGETLTLFGTGLGPYEMKPPEGFPVPGAPRYKLVDTVEVLLGDRSIEPLWAAALPGAIGIDAIQVALPADVSGQNPLSVRVNGVFSNTVVLPVE
ncbi:MAG: hypothetical protein ACE15B_01310 [Bryobacteraceae bacterium]